MLISVSMKNAVPSIIIWRNLVWVVYLGVDFSRSPRKSGMNVRLSQFKLEFMGTSVRHVRINYAAGIYSNYLLQLNSYFYNIPVVYLLWYFIAFFIVTHFL